MLRIGIAGASSLGKSTLAENLSLAHNAKVVAQDDFYLPESELPMIEGTSRPNLDSPKSFDHERYLRALAQRAASDNVIGEGLYAFYAHPEFFTHRILLCAPLELTYERRHPGYENDEIYQSVIKATKPFIEQQRHDADLIIELDADVSAQDVLDQSLALVRSRAHS